MLSIIIVTFGCFISFIVSYILYNGGYKEDGIMLRNATYGVIVFYVFLVLCIGAIPIREV